MQNTSHAVMSQRIEAKDSPDDFPTPPWATRGLMEYVIENKESLATMTCWEPACGAGHMSKVLKEYFHTVKSSDAHYYGGYGSTFDFVSQSAKPKSVDWVITNPPFRFAEEFVLRSLAIAKSGVAILARSVFLESIGRYNAIFQACPPAKFAQFSERVPMVKGRLDRTASTATGYAWLVWEMKNQCVPRLMWVPPCRKRLERANDYERPELSTSQSSLPLDV